jgi:hypothetical protein
VDKAPVQSVQEPGYRSRRHNDDDVVISRVTLARLDDCRAGGKAPIQPRKDLSWLVEMLPRTTRLRGEAEGERE